MSSGARARIPLLLAALSQGCFSESDVDGDSASGGTGTSESTAGTTSSATTSDPTQAPTAEATTASADTSTTEVDGSTTDTNGDVCPSGERQPPSCGDGIATPGEVCFAPFMLIDAGGVGTDIAIADMDLDMRADIVTALANESVGASVRLDRQGVEMPAWGEGPPGHGLALGEFDGVDGLDVAVATVGAPGLLYYGATLMPAPMGTELNVQPEAYLAAGHLDNDDAVDLVAASVHAPFLDVFVGDGMGAFSHDFAARIDLPEDERPRELELADVGGGDELDIVITTTAGRLLVVGNPYGADRIVEVAETLGGGLAVGDLDGDAMPEIVTAEPDGVRVSDGGPDGDKWITADFAVPGGPRDVVIADIDRDMAPDLVVVSPGTSRVHVLQGEGNGDFGRPVQANLPGNANCIRVAVGYLDDDCVLDVAVACEFTGEIAVLYSNP